MEFLRITTETDMARFDEPLVDVSSCAIYFAYRGRNAWQATWVKTYYNGCMHSTADSAMSFVEPQRVQGSVFYVEELPALCLSSQHWNVLITQINAVNPLEDYSINALPQREGHICRTVYGSNDVYLRPKNILRAVLQSFSPDSNFFRTPQSQENSIIMLFLRKVGFAFERITPAVSLKRWESFSQGADNSLGWMVREGGVRASAVQDLVLLGSKV